MWFTPNEIITKQRLFNFVIGPRGNGKTTGMKLYALDKHLKDPTFQVAWVRRYDTERKAVKQKFFDGLDAFGYAAHSFKLKGNTGYVDGMEFVRFFALSKDARIKGANEPNIKLIVFDEFLLNTKSAHYLPDEVNEFLALYDSIARPSDPARKPVPAFLIANSMSIANPYFNFFGIAFKNGKYQNKQIYAEIIHDQEFERQAHSTEFAKMIEGSAYAEHAFDNEFLLDNENFIRPDFQKDQLLYTFIYQTKQYGCWINWKEGTLFISTKTDPFMKSCYYFTREDRTPNYLSCKMFRDTYHGRITKTCYNSGALFFENQAIKSMWYNIARLANL